MQKKNNKDIFLNVLCPSIFLAFTFFIFGPIEMYMTNLSSFWFELKLILPCLLLEFVLVSICLCAVLLVLPGKHISVAALFGVASALYIQGNWTFVDYGQMDGTSINWDAFGYWPFVNSIIWCIVILLPIILSIHREDKDGLLKVFRYISIGIVGMQCISLAVLFFTATPTSNGENYYVATDEQMLELSKDHNIIIMLFDGFQSSYFQQAINEIPEAEEVFEGFTYFDNAVGTSLWTQESSATILTGEQLRKDLPFDENIDYIYETSEFFPKLVEKDYDVRFYESTQMVSEKMVGTIKNIVSEGSSVESPWPVDLMMNKITAFRYMPHLLKKYFYFSYMDIDNLKSGNEYICDDSGFNERVLNGDIHAGENDNVYRMYYFKGCHMPFDLDENAQYITYENGAWEDYNVADIHDNEKLHRQALGSVRIMMNFINALKNENIYDKTDIIITADHGWENRTNPILLVKPAGSVGELEISHAPVSYIEDFGPTVMSMIDSNYQGEKTVFDYKEGEERERIFYIYDINGDRSYNSRSTYITAEEEPYIDKFWKWTAEISRYNLGDDIVFTKDDDGTRYFKGGVSLVENAFVWSLGKRGKMDLEIGNISNDLYGEIQFASIYTPPQSLIISCGNQILYDEDLTSVQEPVKFSIPAECIKEGRLVLNLEYPNAISPNSKGESEDHRELAFAFSLIKFYVQN